jgi:glycosyltransferase involved in cell wall biosynthesis
MRISVVTPSYNQAQYLEQTILSVIGQDYPLVEYIVIDGGSTDGSVDIIRRYESHLAYWVSEKDSGQTDAVAKGFEKSTGDILCWLNSDDVFLPGALSRVARYFVTNPDTETLCGGAYYIDRHGAPILSPFCYSYGDRATFNQFRFTGGQGLVFQQATFWKRNAYEAVGGVNRDLVFIMDLDLFIRLARRKPFARTKELLACFRLHEQTKSLTIQHIRIQESARLAERYGCDHYPRIIRKLLYYWFRSILLTEKLWLLGKRKLGLVDLVPVGNATWKL